MSELKDTAAALVLIDKKFDEIDARDSAHEKRLAELEKYAAALDRAQQTFDNQIAIFRTAIGEQFERLRRELGVGNRRR